MKFAHNMTKLHIVVIFALVAFATSLENKCNVPPEFWCSSEEVARDCQVEFTNLMNVYVTVITGHYRAYIAVKGPLISFNTVNLNISEK